MSNVMNNCTDPVVIVSATYKTTWDDGFGARGWKIDDSIGDPAVIASTSETGEKIPTSVFVHDIVDHHLSGLKLSGHRNEAIALNLLYERTGSDPTPDYAQMVEEDLMKGYVNGEPLMEFLPDQLTKLIPDNLRNNNKLSMGCLIESLGVEALKKVLIRHFFESANSGKDRAIDVWNSSGLDFKKRREIGLAIQRLLKKADKYFNESGAEAVCGKFIITNSLCELEIENTDISYFREYY